MPKPTPYYVEYEDAELIARERARALKDGDGDNVEHGNMIAEEDFEDLEKARAFMRAQDADGRYACIRERTHLVDETLFGLPAWTWWDSDDIVIED